jgi:FAD/FMN-containing dehydrogenase
VSWAYDEDASGYRGHADQVVVPRDEAELVEQVKAAARARAPVTISGGGSGLTGGRVAEGGWTLATDKLDGIRIEPGRAVVGAGVTLQALQAAAKPTGQFYPPDPTETLAYLGGTVACNASGSRSFLYGATRRWVERLRFVLADGTVMDVRRGDAIPFDVPAIPQPACRKHSVGYALRPGMDWIDLITGSEGTLAIVTEVEVRLLPIPPRLLNGIVFFASEESCFDALDAWRGVERLRMLEYVDHGALHLIGQKFPEIPAPARAALIVEQIVDDDGDIDAWAGRLAAQGALDEISWFGTSEADRERFRRFRHALPETVNDTCRRNGFMKLGTDYSVPVPRNREMIAYYRGELDPIMAGRYVIYGHIGDAHPHVNMLPASQADFDHGKRLMTEFARRAVALGGSVAAEHGLGKRKRHLLAIQYSEREIAAMKAVKTRLDPEWRLGRGNLFEPPERTPL